MKQTMLSLLLVFCVQNLMGQSTSISGGYGIAQYANTDEYISESRYSGVTSLFSYSIGKSQRQKSLQVWVSANARRQNQKQQSRQSICGDT